MRTWRPWVLRAPAGYQQPVLVHLVETRAPEDDGPRQLGAFDSEPVAARCVQRLRDEGWPHEVWLNMVAVHSQLEDWQHDR